ncbi:MAG: 5'-3' exonuclease [Kineosporiaceae bacterium]
MSEHPGGLMLVDTPSLYFRAFHGLPQTLVGADGAPVNAVRGLLDMLAFLVELRRPERLVCCFDADWRPAFRVALVPSYKAHRLAHPGAAEEAVPDALSPQVPVILDVLDAFGLARAEHEGFEADDVIGTLATASADGTGVDVVTGDRDLMQLVDDATAVRVLYVGRGVRRLEVIDQAALAAKYGVSTGPRYADVALLRGDASDGLPGVAGIGEKTAAAVVERFGSAQAAREAAAAQDPGLGAAVARRLRDAEHYLDAAAPVVKVVTDIPGLTPTRPDAVPEAPADAEALMALLQAHNLAAPATRLARALGWDLLRE